MGSGILKGRVVVYVLGLIMALCGAVGAFLGSPQPPDGVVTVSVPMRPGAAPAGTGQRPSWSVAPETGVQQAGDVVCVVKIETVTTGRNVQRRPLSLPATTTSTATLAVNDAEPKLAEEMKDYSCLTQLADVVERRTGWPSWAKAVRRLGEPVEADRPDKLLWWCLAALGGFLVFAASVLGGRQT
ncbi:MAG: hypothetical protein QM783_07585 [Phycisphaerales bacterium]